MSVKYIIHCNLDVKSSFNIKGVKYNETSMQYVITGDSDAGIDVYYVSMSIITNILIVGYPGTQLYNSVHIHNNNWIGRMFLW